MNINDNNINEAKEFLEYLNKNIQKLIKAYVISNYSMEVK